MAAALTRLKRAVVIESEMQPTGLGIGINARTLGFKRIAYSSAAKAFDWCFRLGLRN